jgi:MOSC domain-containing protein YiiM
MKVLSVNVGRPLAVPYTKQPEGLTGIDKRPAEGPVRVTAPGPKGVGGSGLAGDAVCDRRHHGGNDQAVYAYAREDLDEWERVLGRPLRDGQFGENLTTQGLDLSHAEIGERWRVGGEDGPLLEVTSGRIPCRTFQGHLGERGWVKRFSEAGLTGAYLRVLEEGTVRAGDAVEIVHRPGHGVTTTMEFRATTTQRELLPRLAPAGEALHTEVREELERLRATRGVAPA